MARITRFTKAESIRGSLHRTTVECGYAIFEKDGHRVLQLDTYGSEDRQIPGKVSQTLQLDQPAAAELHRLLESAFPGLRD